MSFLDASNQPFALKAFSTLFILVWCVIACFPLLWITIMSLKLPLDAFDSNFFNVLVGPVTLQLKNGVSVGSILAISLFSIYFYLRPLGAGLFNFLKVFCLTFFHFLKV